MKEIIGLVAIRTESRRLKNKAFRRILGKPIIKILTERLKKTPYLEDFIICTTADKSDNVIEEFCRREKVKYFRGENENVLKRFVDASKILPSKYVVRITGDNPLTDFESMSDCYLHLKGKNADYSRPIGVPLGTAGEVIRTEKLYELLDRSLNPELSEYMTYFFELAPFIKSELYKIKEEIYMPDLRLTIDYESDLVFVEALIKHFNGIIPSLKEIVKYCRGLNNYPKVSTFGTRGLEIRSKIRFD